MEREKISILLLLSLSLATPFPSLCFVEHSTNNRPTLVAQYNDILLEGIPRRASTCLHPPRMKLSREVAYKYITIRTQYSIPSYWPSRSDFPFSRLKGIPPCVHAYVCAREEGQGVRCLHTGRGRGGDTGKNIIQSIHRPVLLEMKSRWKGLDISFLYSSLSTASFRHCCISCVCVSPSF